MTIDFRDIDQSRPDADAPLEFFVDQDQADMIRAELCRQRYQRETEAADQRMRGATGD